MSEPNRFCIECGVNPAEPDSDLCEDCGLDEELSDDIDLDGDW